MRKVAVDFELPDSQRGKFTAPQSGRHRQLVGQRSFDAELFLPSDERRIVLKPCAGTFNSVGEFVELQGLSRPRRRFSGVEDALIAFLIVSRPNSASGRRRATINSLDNSASVSARRCRR